MRFLKYPRVVSVQSFQSPNFELVADLLCWMTHRYDGDITIHTSIDTEHDRILFITGIVKSMYLKANIKLNAKKLYSADGHAVKELLELASILRKAIVVSDGEPCNKYSDGGGSSSVVCNYDDSKSSHHSLHHGKRKNSVSELINLTDVKNLRKLASEVTEKGAKLFELLQKEKAEEGERRREESLKFLDAVSSGFDDCPEVQHIESTLLQLLEEKKNQVIELERECKVMESDKSDLIEEMKKKTLDLERNKKRLESIQNARPAFMDEYEQLEIELQKHYDLYMERYRNIHYLKKEMEKFQREEEEKLNEIQRSKRKLQSKMHEEELKILRDEYPLNDEKTRPGRRKQMFQDLDSAIDDAVPLLDTTQDSSIIIEADDNDIDNSNVFLEDDENLSGNDGASFEVSTGTGDSRDGSHTILSSKASSSFSGMSGISSNGNEDDESNDMICNESSDSSDNF